MAFPLLALLLAGCQPGGNDLVLSRLRGHGDGVGGVSLAMRGDGGLSDDAVVTVQSRADSDAAWVDATVTTSGGDDRLEIALVADNSGSEQGYLEPMQEAVQAFGDNVLGRGLGDKVAMVRVTTQSQIVLPLTDDEAAWSTAVDDLFIGNGWTALWDGVRLGNEALDAGADLSEGDDSLELCMSQARRSIVVFTDGQENNSADQHETSFDGDGIDTTTADLVQLNVLGVPTPIHAIGIGNGVDEDALSTLAGATGGAYAAIDGYEDLAATLTATADGLSDEIPVCFEVSDCTHQEARIVVTDGDESWEVLLDLPDLCPDETEEPETEEPGEPGCTRTRGYWKNHEESWPVDSLVLGGISYTQAECLEILDAPTRGDVSYQMASQLIASKLNVAAGADDSDIADVIVAADAWIVDHDIDGSGIPLGTVDYDGDEDIKDDLDDWNNGVTGPGHCD